MRSRIAGTGSYLPAKQVDNNGLVNLIGPRAVKIERTTGIASRHVVEGGEGVSDLALRASLEALRMARCHPNDVDCVVFATQSPEYFFPGSGCMLGAKLGLIGVAALDVRNQECGFLYGVSVADHFVRVGTYRTVLVVAAEVMSSLFELSPGVPDEAVVYGDGAGAVLVASDEGEKGGILACGLHSDGRFARAHMMPAPERPGGRAKSGKKVNWGPPVFGGPEMIHEAVRRVDASIEEALERSGLSARDVSLLIANVGALGVAEDACRRLGMERTRLYSRRRVCGDVGAASVALSLDAAIRNHVVDAGDIVLLCSFGGGFTWAWAVVRL